jgi:hypothetical protein
MSLKRSRAARRAALYGAAKSRCSDVEIMRATIFRSIAVFFWKSNGLAIGEH